MAASQYHYFPQVSQHGEQKNVVTLRTKDQSLKIREFQRNLVTTQFSCVYDYMTSS